MRWTSDASVPTSSSPTESKASIHRTGPAGFTSFVDGMLPVLLLVAGLGSPAGIDAQQDFDEVEIRTIPVADGVYMLTGSGGNLGVAVGEDGVFVIDDQYAPLTERILAAIGELSPEPVRFVFNTHWHGDHTGGNENMGEAGALLVAHENVRARLSVDQVLARFGSEPDTTPAAPEGALPVVTFTEEVSFHLNGGSVRAVHVPHAHTDGDAILHFEDADVVHMGDTYFNGMYPFIDVATGGTIDGYLAAQGRALALMDADTKVIPGHGPLSNREELREHRDMLHTIRDRVWEAKEAGRSLEEVRGMGVTREWDEEFGGGFIGSDQLVGFIYTSLPPAR